MNRTRDPRFAYELFRDRYAGEQAWRFRIVQHEPQTTVTAGTALYDSETSCRKQAEQTIELLTALEEQKAA